MSRKLWGPGLALAVRLISVALGTGALGVLFSLHVRALAAPTIPAYKVLVGSTSCSGITSYPAHANGDLSPVSDSGLCDPGSVALDSKGNIYVANFDDDKVTVYPPGTKGNVTPSAVISGSTTGLSRPAIVSVDDYDNIYVGNYAINTVTVYAAGSDGNIAPSVTIATIAGSSTLLEEPTGVAIGNIYAADLTPKLLVYPPGSNGNVLPKAIIEGSNTGLDFPRGVALDATGKQV